MIKNYFNFKKILDLKNTLYLLVVFFAGIELSNAQCATPIAGCSNTDLSNFGAASNNNAATIEYDNFVSSWHTTIVRTSDGSFQTWGETISNTGANQLAPVTINRTNFPALSAGAVPLKAALGSTSSNNVQGILLATDGLYAWSKPGMVLDASLTTSAVFQKLTIGGNTNGLPAGVAPGDVKMMFGTYKTLAITTCSGDVWVISQTAAVRGNGALGNNTTWYRVRTSEAGNPFLTDVVACRGNNDGLMALKSDGTVYVWGVNVFLGNSTVAATQNYAAPMSIPVGITPKMIGSTGNGTLRSHYILATDGSLYALGNNTNRQLGDWSTATERLAWVQPRYNSSSTSLMNDVKWFSPQEHDSQYAAINVLTNGNKIYAFGNSNGSLLGIGSGTANNPTTPGGLLNSDNILAVETGGHTSMLVKSCETKFGYVGHRISGSMGDGTSNSTNETSYTFATANVQICGAESNPAIQPISTGGGPDSKYCVDDPVLLNPTPAGGTLSIVSGPGSLSGNTLNFTAVGTVSVQYTVTTSCGGTSVTTRSFDAALCPADLEITKVADNSVASVGNTVVFTITAKNNGPYKATGVTVNDVLPSGYSLVSAVPSSGTWSAPNWTIGSLANGESASLSVTTTVNATGLYTNTASISGNNPDGTAGNDAATAAPVVQADLSVTKSVNNATPSVGSTVTFTITASNAGPSTATGVKVTDVLPSGYTFVSATPSTGTWSAPDWNIGNLANGASTTLTMEAVVKSTGIYANTASISGEESDVTLGNNSETITPTINNAPAAVKDIYTVAEDNTVTLTPLINDTDADGDALSIVSINGTALTGSAQVITVPDGIVNISASGVITFTPSADFNSAAAVSFPYVVTDGSLTASANIEITVTAVNDAPSAVKDEYTVAEDNTVTLTPLINDTDADGDALSIVSINETALTGSAQVIAVPDGTVNISASGVITFTPSADFNSAAPVIFPYVVTDGSLTASANIEITVTAVNDAPSAVKDEYTVAEDNTVTLTPLINDTDIDGDALSIVSINGTALTGSAQVITVPDGTVNISASGVITFTPSADFNSAAPVSFPYVVTDGSLTASANIEITVTAVNDAPSAVKDIYTVAEDNTVTLTPLINDTDADGDALSIVSINGTALTGSAQVITVPDGTVNISASGVITFTPSADFNSAAPVSFPYVVTDGTLTASANIEITVTAVNDAPSAVKDIYTVAEDNTVTLTPLINDTDADGDALSIVSINGTALTGSAQVIAVPDGTVNISASGVITFTPSADFNSAAPVIFPYVVTDGSLTASANIEITVTAVNDAPSAVKDEYTVAEDNTVTLTPLINDTDIDGDALSIVSINGTALTGSAQVITVPDGTVNISASGVITFTPSADFNSAAPVSFPYVVTDGTLTASANIEITVTAVNDAPSAVKDEYTVAEDNTVTLTPLINDTDADGDALSIVSINGTALTGSAQVIAVPDGTVNISASGVITFTPSADFNSAAPVSFPYVVTDGSLTASANIEITVTAVNDAPIANDDTNNVIISTAGATTINALTASDVDGTIANYTILTLPPDGALSLMGTPIAVGQILTPAEAAMITYTPSGTFTGNVTFTFTAADDLGLTAVIPGTITIPIGNNAPAAHDNTNSNIPSRAGATAIKALTATDTDGTIINYIVKTLPAHGVLALSGVPVTVNQTLTPAEAAMLTYDPSGAFSGNDTFTFTATDNNGAVDATPATITITVDKTTLIATPDPIGTVVGINEVVEIVNVLTNDTLNNDPLLPVDVKLDVLVKDPNNVLTLKPDGTVELIPNAPAGNYSLTYEICEKVNPSNCTSAIVSVTVEAPKMTVTANSYCSDNTPYVSYNVKADNFTPKGLLTINWIDSANNIVATQTNMPLSGNVLWPGAVVDSNNKPIDWPGWVLVNGQWIEGNDGFELTRPAVTMQFTLNPTESVTVNYPAPSSGCNARPYFGIEAENDNDNITADGINGSAELINVLDNDKLNGAPVNPADVILTPNNFPAGITLNSDGTIDVAPGTKGGSHTLTYQICEKANPLNCSDATVNIFVEVPSITLVMKVELNDQNKNDNAEAGETLTYTYTITNNGNVPLQNITISNLLPGIVITGGPISLAVGESDSHTFTGTYTLTQADINAGKVVNQATASGTTLSGIKVEDKSDSNNDNGDVPTEIDVNGCQVKIYNAVSLNGDDMNERFYIRGIECYPDNTVQIFNRWGVLVFERDHYNNNDVVFKGFSEGRTTIKESNGLPEGTYYYIVRYKDNNSSPKQEAGYLYLTK